METGVTPVLLCRKRTGSFSPNSLCSLNFRRRCCRREKLALLLGEFSQSFLETLASPFTGLGDDFSFDVGQPRK